MRNLKYNSTSELEEYRYSIVSMQQALLEAGYQIDAVDLFKAWKDYSSSMAAGWMMSPDEGEEIYWCIRPYVDDYE